MLRVRCHACVGKTYATQILRVLCCVRCTRISVRLPNGGWLFFFCVCQRSRGGNSQTTPDLPARLHSHSGDSLVTEEETPGTHTHTRDRETPLHTCTRGRVSARSPLPPPQFHSLHLQLNVGSVTLSDTEPCHSFLVILRIVS